MRATIHMVSARDYPLMAAGVREARRAWFLKASRHQGRASVFVSAARRVEAMLSDGPRRRSDIVTQLNLDSVTWNGVGLWLDLVRVPPCGTWDRRRADLYGLAKDWLGPGRQIPTTAWISWSGATWARSDRPRARTSPRGPSCRGPNWTARFLG